MDHRLPGASARDLDQYVTADTIGSCPFDKPCIAACIRSNAKTGMVKNGSGKKD